MCAPRGRVDVDRPRTRCGACLTAHYHKSRGSPLHCCDNRSLSGLTIMNIAFFGSSLLSAYWNGAATYYRGIIKALSRRGHRVTFYEPDAYDRQSHRDIKCPPWAEVRVYSADGYSELLSALEEARAAEMVIKCSGVGVFDQFLEHEVLRLKRAGTMVAFWDVDAPATLARVEENSDDPFR